MNKCSRDALDWPQKEDRGVVVLPILRSLVCILGFHSRDETGHVRVQSNGKMSLKFGSVENAECGVRSVENAGCGKCGVWKMRGVENAGCGKCGVWKMRGVEKAECGKCVENFNFPSHFVIPMWINNV